MKETGTNFSGDIARQIRHWWKDIERFGFDPRLTSDEENGENPKWQTKEKGLCIEDPFKTVTSDDIEYLSEGDETLRGSCTVHTKSGFILNGYFHKGKRRGPGILTGPSLEAKGLRGIWGNYKLGVLTGKGRAELIDKDSTTLEGYFCDGKLEGQVRGLSPKGVLTWVSSFHCGRPVGPCWKGLHGGTLIYSDEEVSCEGKLSGDNVAFIYPDFETVLIGRFSEDVMIEARESKVIGYTIENGILRLQFDKQIGEVFSYWPSRLNEVVCPPLQADPYENKILYAGTSSMEGAGDGLFVKVDVPANTTVAFYNGIRVKPGETGPYEGTGYQIYVDWNKSKVITSDFMDIPPDYVSLANYKASLGHKVNHSFESNCRWGTIDHPTFGRVPRIVTLRDISAGSELTIHYKIDMEEAACNDHTQWYVHLWEVFSLKGSAVAYDN